MIDFVCVLVCFVFLSYKIFRVCALGARLCSPLLSNVVLCSLLVFAPLLSSLPPLPCRRSKPPSPRTRVNVVSARTHKFSSASFLYTPSASPQCTASPAFLCTPSSALQNTGTIVDYSIISPHFVPTFSKPLGSACGSISASLSSAYRSISASPGPVCVLSQLLPLCSLFSAPTLLPFRRVASLAKRSPRKLRSSSIRMLTARVTSNFHVQQRFWHDFVSAVSPSSQLWHRFLGSRRYSMSEFCDS